MSKQNIEIRKCVRCGIEILDKDDYLEIIEHIKGIINRKEFYHIKCFDDGNMIKKMALNLALRTNKLLGRAEEVMA